MSTIRTLITSNVRIELLRILALNPESSFHINELSRRTGFSLRGVVKELKNLHSGGILKREVVGNQHRYQLDPNCPIYSEIKGLIIKTVGIGELVKDSLRPIEKGIELAFLYGSFAAGDYGKESDVDLCIVTESSGIKLAGLLGPLQNQTGRAINISQFSPSEYRQMKAKGDHFLSRILEGPKIIIIGHIDEP
jgi:DNA-binding Lrp family transcriptional regulator